MDNVAADTKFSQEVNLIVDDKHLIAAVLGLGDFIFLDGIRYRLLCAYYRLLTFSSRCRGDPRFVKVDRGLRACAQLLDVAVISVQLGVCYHAYLRQ